MAKDNGKQVMGGIRFGDWMLTPCDNLNWELCHRHVTSDNAKARGAGSAGEVRWHRLGRFYSYNTIHLAVQYAADQELKAKAHGTQMELQDALHEYAAIVDALKSDVLAALDGDAH